MTIFVNLRVTGVTGHHWRSEWLVDIRASCRYLYCPCICIPIVNHEDRLACSVIVQGNLINKLVQIRCQRPFVCIITLWMVSRRLRSDGDEALYR